jgi:hypothetical protein
MIKLGVISAKVIAGRSIDRHPLSTTDVPYGSERYSSETNTGRPGEQ